MSSRHLQLRIYAYFGLAILTVLLPPLMPVTLPLLYFVWHCGRKRARVEQAWARRKAWEKRDREFLSAMRSLP